MKTRFATLVALLVILVGASICALAQKPPTSQGQPPQATAQQQVSVGEAALTNEDIVRLSKMGLGDEVAIAKINQAQNVDFKLDTSNLITLKSEGVSKAVIAAMLKRTSASQGQSASSPAGSGGGANYARPSWAPTNPGDEGVILRTTQGETRLQSVQGDISTTFAVVTELLFLDFPGLKADVRITDPRPTIVVHCSKSPRGRVFLVRCKQNSNDSNRSVKLGKSGMFSQKSWSTPDRDWLIAFDMKELPNNTWEITPKQDMKQGEYGVLFKGGFSGMLESTGGELFDFGVDK